MPLDTVLSLHRDSRTTSVEDQVVSKLRVPAEIYAALEENGKSEGGGEPIFRIDTQASTNQTFVQHGKPGAGFLKSRPSLQHQYI